jgi:hypothetical protein
MDGEGRMVEYATQKILDLTNIQQYYEESRLEWFFETKIGGLANVLGTARGVVGVVVVVVLVVVVVVVVVTLAVAICISLSSPFVVFFLCFFFFCFFFFSIALSLPQPQKSLRNSCCNCGGH